MTKSKSHEFLAISNWQRETINEIKKYPKIQPDTADSSTDTETIPLPFSWDLDEARIRLLIQQRRSLRKYSDELVTIDDVAFLLWASQGITAKIGNHNLRATPSAGALYPYETYVIVTGVTDLTDGLYFFNVNDFSLKLIELGELAPKFAKACLNQKFIGNAPINIIWSGLPNRCLEKYGDRGLRYLLLDLGHLCQNILLGAEALGCGGCPVAAFFDNEVNSLVGVDGENEMVLYAVSVGRKPKEGK